MSDFIAALRAEFGSQIANAASAHLATLTDAGNKPLKAFMIRQTVDKAISTTQANLNIRDKFYSGIDPEHSFEAKFTAILQDPKEFTLPMDEESKAIFKNTLIKDINAYMLQNNEKVSTADLERHLYSLPAVYAARQLFSASSALPVLPGSPEDKMNIAHMLSHSEIVCTVAMQKLPLCRMLQPEGALTRASVWQAVMGSPMPEEMESLPASAFGQTIEKTFSQKMAETLKSQKAADRAMSCLCKVKLESAMDIAKTGRPLTKDDYISPDSRLAICAEKAKNNYAEHHIAKDIFRMATTNKTGQPTFTGVHFHKADGTVETMAFGKTARETFPFRDEADRTAFKSGFPSSFTRQLLDNCRTMCDNREEQAQSLLSLFSQTPLRVFAGVNYSSEIGSLIPSELNEHMTAVFDASQQADGSIRLEIQSNEIPERSGRGTMTVIVGTDGSLTMESCKMESAANVMEQNLRTMISDLITAPTFSQDNKAILAKIAGDALVSKSLHLQDPGTWKSAIEPLLAKFYARPAIMDTIQSIPQQIAPQTAQAVCRELENSIASYYQQSYNQMDENGIFPSYIKDTLRNSVETINGEALRLVPTTHRGPVPMETEADIPVGAIREQALQEQIMQAIPNRELRCFVSQVASQAGLEGSLSVQLAGSNPEQQTPPWQNYVNFVNLINKSLPESVNYNYPNHKYIITTDELVPGRPVDDPVNEDKGIHIQLNMTQGLEGMADDTHYRGELVNFTVRMDIPYNQPPHEEGQPPVFHISSLEAHPA